MFSTSAKPTHLIESQHLSILIVVIDIDRISITLTVSQISDYFGKGKVTSASASSAVVVWISSYHVGDQDSPLQAGYMRAVLISLNMRRCEIRVLLLCMPFQ